MRNEIRRQERGHGAAFQLHRRGNGVRRALELNGQALYMLLCSTLDSPTDCSAVEALMPELKGEWNSSCIDSLQCMESR